VPQGPFQGAVSHSVETPMSKRIDIRIVATLFMVLAIVLRLVPHAYNLAAIGAAAMFIGCFWSARIGVLACLAAMAVSDILGHFLAIPSMGFYAPWMMATVYGSMAASALIGKAIKAGHSGVGLPLWLGAVLGSLASTAVFFLVTNFACWLDPTMSNYPRTLSGLGECYVAALPFTRNTLIGNLAFTGLFFGAFAAGRALIDSSAVVGTAVPSRD